MICIKFIYTRSYALVGVGKLTTPPKVDYFFLGNTTEKAKH